MFCPYCGSEQPDGARYCGKCGKEISQFQATPTRKPAGGVNGMTGGASRASISSGLLAKGHRILSVVVAVVVVAVVVFAVRGIFFGSGQKLGGGYDSAEKAAQSLDASMSELFSKQGDADSAKKVASAILDAMPADALDAQIKGSGYENREEAVAEMEKSMDSLGSSVESLGKYLEKMDLTVEAVPGDSLDGDVIDNVNDRFEELGIDKTVTRGRQFKLDVTVTLREDVSGMGDKGDTQSRSLGNFGLILIEVDGSWYLWPTAFNW